MEIRRAERKRARARIGLCGPAGSGKTHSALRLAAGMGKTIVLIDTENGSGEQEEGKPNIPEYNVITIRAPFEVKKYLAAIALAEKGSDGIPPADVIIIDSLSHAWAGSGGLLDKQADIARSGKGNSYTAWRDITPEHNNLIEAMLQSPAHIIATMRSKTEYVLQGDDKGKQVPKKVGMAPVQREGMDYEFTLVFEIDQNTHYATASKDRTSMFDGKTGAVLTQETGRCLLEWFDSGAGVKPDNAGPVSWYDTDEGKALVANFSDILTHSSLAESDQEKWYGFFMASKTIADAATSLQRAVSKLAERAKARSESVYDRIKTRLGEMWTDTDCADARAFLKEKTASRYGSLHELLLATETELTALWKNIENYGPNAS